MSFYTNDNVVCPRCPPLQTKHGPMGIALDCTVHNYSGCCVDFGECPICHKIFQISYRVDEIHEVKTNRINNRS